MWSKFKKHRGTRALSVYYNRNKLTRVGIPGHFSQTPKHQFRRKKKTSFSLSHTVRTRVYLYVHAHVYTKLDACVRVCTVAEERTTTALCMCAVRFIKARAMQAAEVKFDSAIPHCLATLFLSSPPSSSSLSFFLLPRLSSSTCSFCVYHVRRVSAQSLTPRRRPRNRDARARAATVRRTRNCE